MFHATRPLNVFEHILLYYSTFYSKSVQSTWLGTVPSRGSTWDRAFLGEPRTVFGPLAARSVPSPLQVLRPWRDRPQASGVPGFLLWPAQAGCKVRLEPHGGVGSSLLPILWWGRVTPNPSPCS